jgi:hypothetical protein
MSKKNKIYIAVVLSLITKMRQKKKFLKLSKDVKIDYKIIKFFS